MKRTILTIFVLVLATQLGAKEPLERSYSICLDQLGPINNSVVFKSCVVGGLKATSGSGEHIAFSSRYVRCVEEKL